MPARPAVIEYAPRAGSGFGWRREGDALTLVVPPGPLWLSVPRIAAPPLAISPFPALVSAGSVACFVNGGQMLFAGIVSAALAAVLWALTVLSLVAGLRAAGRPTVIRATAAGLDVSSGASGHDRRAWERGQIVDIAVVRAGALPAIQQYLHLWVTTRDGERTVIRMPWPKGAPMALVEDNLRDVLRLPVAEQ